MLVQLRRIVKEISTATSLDDALAIAVQRIKASMATDVCSIYLTDPESNRYPLMATDGLNPASVGKVRVGRTEGLVGWIADHEEAINLPNAADHPWFRSSPETGDETYHAFLGAPIIHYRRILGVLVAQKRERRQFDRDEMAFFVTLAAELGGAVNHLLTKADFQRLLTGWPHETLSVQGIKGAPGIAMGIVALSSPGNLVSVVDRKAQDIGAEERAFRSAIARVKEELRSSSDRMRSVLPSEVQALFKAYIMLLESDSLISNTVARIHAGNWARGALRDTIAEHAQVFEQMEDPYLAARAEDIRALGQRILIHLQGDAGVPRHYPEPCILAGEEVSVTEITRVPREQLAGILCRRGSALSHTAILARGLGIPAVMGIDLPIGYLEGCKIVIDGDQGCVYVQPSRAMLAEFQQRIREQEAISARLAALRTLPAETPDGVRMPLYVNMGLDAADASALNSGAEGVGLYRTEFFFLARESLPVEDEQYRLYRNLLEAFAPRPVTIRTLDVGGDKPLPFLSLEEDNPFLGWRGIRVTLDHPEIFLMQLRALLRANAGLNNLQVLFPMIGRLSEIDDALTLLERAYQELLEEGRPAAKPPVGAVIEVPSAAYLAGALARRTDFLSVGTNDLTQYLLAVDRNNARVAGLYDSLHPAVINAVRDIINKAHQEHRLVSVCGEMAGDPAAALLLLGMGIDALSMDVSSLPRVKWAIRSFTKQRACDLVDKALEMEDETAVHRLLNTALKRAGLGVLVRA